MNLASVPVRRPVATAMAFLAIAVLGIAGLARIPLELFPPLTGDRLFVQFARPGSDPEIVERELLRPLAAQAARLDGVEESFGSVQGSGGSLSVRFTPGTDLGVRELELRRAASEIARAQPPGTFVEVGAEDFSAISRFVMMVQVVGLDDPDALYDLVDERVRPRLAAVPGVAQVLPTGGAGRELTVTLDPDRAAALGIDPRAVTAKLAAAVRRVEFLGGLENGDRRTAVMLQGLPAGPVEIGELVVGEAAPVKLRHVAEVDFGSGVKTRSFRVNGGAAVGLIVFKEESANLVAVGRALRARIADLTAELAPQGIEFTTSFDGADIVEDELGRLRNLAISGFLVSIAVLYVFLRQWRAVAVVAVAVPVSLLAAFAVLYLFGLTLNIVTLFGLAVGVGMLVDNSIVVYEAVQRRLERGHDAASAAEAGVRRTFRAIAASSLTNAIVFLPLAFTAIEDTAIRSLVRVLALAIVIPLAASLLVAIGLVPLLAHRLAAPAALRRLAESRVRVERLAGWSPPDRARELFGAILKVAVRRPAGWIAGLTLAIVLTLVIALPLVAFGLATQEASEADSVQLAVELPYGGSLAAATERFEVLEEAARGIEGVRVVESLIEEDRGTLTVHLVDREERPKGTTAAHVREVVREAARRVSGIDVRNVSATDDGGGADRGAAAAALGQAPMQVVLSGPDASRLSDLGREVEARLRAIPEIASARLSSRPGLDEIRVYPDDGRFAAYGLTPDAILPVLGAVRREGVDLRVGYTLPDGREIPLTVRRPERRVVLAVRDLQSLRVPSEAGVLPLSAVADVRKVPGLPTIEHHDGRREIAVLYTFKDSAAATGTARATLEARVREAVRQAHRPTGYTVETPEPDAGFAWFRKLLLPAILLLYAVLAITFESLTLPALILIALPLTVLGGVWSLALSGTPAGPMALAGALALVGLTVNPAILLVDRMQERVRRGAAGAGAAAVAGVRERTRPVLMTVATTLAGLWPLAISTGRENELWPPFAIVVMGGLFTSALLTLIAIPVGFTILHRLDRLFGRLGPWVVLGWMATTAGVLYALILGNVLTTLTWQIATAALIGGLLLGGAALAFRAPAAFHPETSHGPPVLETRVLGKVYGRPGPIGRAWRVTERFVRFVRDRGGPPFDPAEARSHVVPWVLVAAGFAYLAAAMRTPFWKLVFAYVAALVVAGALEQLRRARGRVDELGRALPGGPEGWLAAAAPWFALGWFALEIGRTDDGFEWSTPARVALALAGLATAVVQWGRRTARRVAHGEIPEAVADGRLRRPRTVVRRAARKWFGAGLPPTEVRALRGVDLRFEQGMTGILGPNGAGKTTLLRIVAGVLDPSIGTVHLGGVPMRTVRSRLARWLGYLPQDFGLPQELTARQYLEYYALLYDIPRTERAQRVARLLDEVGLHERADERISGYSGGMRQRVAVARTLLRLPPVIVVDEPTVGLDPRERIRFRNLLARLAEGRVVLFSTHVVEDVAVACPRVVVLAQGQVVYDGPPEDLARMASGRVWEVRLLEGEAADLAPGSRVVDQVPEPGGLYRTRVLADAQPHPAAIEVEPGLEDGYLLLVADARREAAA